MDLRAEDKEQEEADNDDDEDYPSDPIVPG